MLRVIRIIELINRHALNPALCETLDGTTWEYTRAMVFLVDSSMGREAISVTGSIKVIKKP